MERSRESLSPQAELELQIDQRVEILQDYIDESISSLSDPELADTERQLASLKLNEDVAHEIEQLNQLEPYLSQPVRVTGNIQRAYYDQFEERDAIESVQVQSEPMESAGFVVWPVNSDDGESRQVVGHLFHNNLPPRVSTTNALTHHASAYYSFAPYKSVTIERPYTYQEVLSHLEVQAPEALYQLESRLLNIESPEQALVSLAELEYDQDELDETSRVGMVEYANRILDLAALPLLKIDMIDSYHRSVLGMPMSLSLKGDKPSVAARLNGVSLFQDTRQEAGRHHWSVRAEVHATDSANRNLLNCPDFSLPAKNIAAINQLPLDS